MRPYLSRAHVLFFIQTHFVSTLTFSCLSLSLSRVRAICLSACVYVCVGVGVGAFLPLTFVRSGSCINQALGTGATDWEETLP
jgi:hypothetical protein